MPLKVWLSTTDDCKSPLHGAVDNHIRQFVQYLETKSDRQFTMAPSANEADIILFIESPIHKFREYAHQLLADELIQQYPNRCFVFDWEDGPPCFLPGVYPSLTEQQYDPARVRAGGYLSTPNTAYIKESDAAWRTPELLLSFRGANSHPLRAKLFESEFKHQDISITIIDRWFNHNDDERAAYTSEILNSKFVICPRGQGTSSIRLFETMASGRVPVILSDDWLPPLGPSWGEFSLRVSERRLSDLPEIVRSYEPQWQEMGKEARNAWEQWYSPAIICRRVLQAIEEILLMRPPDHNERDIQRQWLSWKFARKNGWTLPQKVVTAVRRGEVMTRLRVHLPIN